MKGYVGKLPGSQACLAAFRGSTNIWNYLADGQAMMVDWDNPIRPWCYGCKVHAGFGESYEEIRQSFLQAVKDLGCDSVQMTGHSLGAAVATMAASDLRADNMRVDPLYLFGSPRVGNLAFARVFEDLAAKQDTAPSSWRIIHFHDPMVHIPYWPADSQVAQVDLATFRNNEWVPVG